jgi:hypothetical protein
MLAGETHQSPVEVQNQSCNVTLSAAMLAGSFSLWSLCNITLCHPFPEFLMNGTLVVLYHKKRILTKTKWWCMTSVISLIFFRLYMGSEGAFSLTSVPNNPYLPLVDFLWTLLSDLSPVKKISPRVQ